MAPCAKKRAKLGGELDELQQAAAKFLNNPTAAELLNDSVALTRTRAARGRI